MAKKRRKRGRHPGQSLPYTDRAFLPYVTALGQLALAWNGLHEMLCFLFCQVMGGGYVNQFLAIWHALKADRAQREILLAALKEHGRGAYPAGFVEDIQWICNRADVLEDARMMRFILRSGHRKEGLDLQWLDQWLDLAMSERKSF